MWGFVSQFEGQTYANGVQVKDAKEYNKDQKAQDDRRVEKNT